MSSFLSEHIGRPSHGLAWLNDQPIIRMFIHIQDQNHRNVNFSTLNPINGDDARAHIFLDYFNSPLPGILDQTKPSW